MLPNFGKVIAQARPRRRGSSLIIVLGVLSMLAVAISTFVTFTRINFRASQGRSYSSRMDMLSAGVLQQVRIILAKDLEANSEPFDHPGWDPWLASITNDGGSWPFISRLDTPDRPTPDAQGFYPVATRLRAPAPVPSTNSTSTVNLAGDYYVDTDSDGVVDALLLPLGGTFEFPDGITPYYAVRIVDNAHYNSRHHLKWHHWRDGTNHVTSPPDNSHGAVDWGQNRPRLPHVNFRGQRNHIERRTSRSDNPDRAPGGTTADPDGGTGYDFDRNFDAILGTDTDTTLVDHDGNPVTPNVAAASNWQPPVFTLEDDLALRTFESDASMTKYLQLWPFTFGTPATVAITGTGAIGWCNNQRRLTSSTTRTSTLAWVRPTAAGPARYQTKFELRRLTDVFTANPTTAARQAAAVPLLDQLFAAMAARNILQTDDRRAQYLANLYEYVCPPDPNDLNRYPPIVYRNRIGMTRQPYITEIVRQGTPNVLVTTAGRATWVGRLGVDLYNPYETPLNLEPYTLRITSTIPSGGQFIGTNGTVGGAIVQGFVDITFPPNTQIPPFSNFFVTSDGSGDFTPADAAVVDGMIRIGPRLRVELLRTVPGSPTNPVVFDAAEPHVTTVNALHLDWSDWETPTLGSTAQWYAAVNNQWMVPAGGANVTSRGYRSACYRPQGNPLSWDPQNPAWMTDEWIGLARWGTTSNADPLMRPRPAAPPYANGGRNNPAQAQPNYNANPVSIPTNFIFGYALFLPKRGLLAHSGEMTRVLTVGNEGSTPATKLFRDASVLGRTRSNGWGPVDNRWARLNGERALRYDAYEPTDNFANARLFDFVTVYHSASGQNGPYAPLALVDPGGAGPFDDRLQLRDANDAGAPISIGDDTDEDTFDPNADGAFRPLYREGLVNVNTAPGRMLKDLVFPQGERTATRVTDGNNVLVAENLANRTRVLGEAFERVSDVILWARATDPANFEDNSLEFRRRWDIGLNRRSDDPGRDLGSSNNSDSPDVHNPFRTSYPGFNQAVPLYAPLTAANIDARVPFRRFGYTNDMAERDQLWAGNTNVLTTRSDTFTVYVLVMLVRIAPGNPALVENLGVARLTAIVDRTNCNPLLSIDNRRLILPKVLAKQFAE